MGLNQFQQLVGGSMGVIVGDLQLVPRFGFREADTRMVVQLVDEIFPLVSRQVRNRQFPFQQKGSLVVAILLFGIYPAPMIDRVQALSVG